MFDDTSENEAIPHEEVTSNPVTSINDPLGMSLSKRSLAN
jgi:hypothetical protein